MYIMHITYINVINAWNMLISLYYEIYLFFFIATTNRCLLTFDETSSCLYYEFPHPLSGYAQVHVLNSLHYC